LLEPAQVIGLAQRELCLGATQLELVGVGSAALRRVQVLAGALARGAV
jgi:hypothetical protein